MNQSGKKIAIVSASFPPYVNGGIASAHYNLHKALNKKGHFVRTFTFLDHVNREATDEVSRFGSPSLLLKGLRFFIRCYCHLLRRAETFQFAYQFPYCLEAAVGSWRIGRALKGFAPDVLVLPDNGSPGFYMGKPDNCKTVLIAHHNYLRFVGEPLFGLFSRIDARMAHALETRGLKKVDLVVCPSHYMKDVFIGTHSFSGPVAVVPNLVDAELIDSIAATDVRAILDIPEDAPVIFIPSGGTTFKGSRYVYELIRRLSAGRKGRVGFVLSGGITDKVLEREVSFAPDNAKIYMPGTCSYAENISILKACDLCVSPTLIENFGMSMLEANFCSLPVITFDVGGNADIVVNGTNGFLVSFLDMEKLVSHADNLLSNRAMLADLKAASYQYVINKFGAEHVADMFERVICEQI